MASMMAPAAKQLGKHKSTILAVVLSLLVIVGWQYFIGYPQMERQRQEAQLKQETQLKQQPQTEPATAEPTTPPKVTGSPNAATPSTQAQAASRQVVIGASPRVAINTPSLGGSIDLKGGRIDDLTLTQYRETTDPASPPIVLFSPSGAPGAFYAEFGWVPAIHTNAVVPGPDTVWKQQGICFMASYRSRRTFAMGVIREASSRPRYCSSSCALKPKKSGVH
jgi:YidC/Oxa1 family membrane protein insertase